MTSLARLGRVITTLALLAVGAVAVIAHAAEPAYPTRSIRLVIGFPPGGALDVLARHISPKLSDAMGQVWVVENRAGAGGNLASEIVARANPDGHTVLLALNTQLTASPSLYKLPFSVEKDLQPLTMVAVFEHILVVHPGVPARTLQEFVALAKQKPDALNYASVGMGSTYHLIAELLMRRAGIHMMHVPYKGSAPATAGLLAGETQAMLGALPAMMPHITAGRLRGLATTGLKRHKLTPEVPTVAESGYPGFESVSWMALLAPGATPKSVAERIRSEVIKALQHADMETAMVRLGLDPETGTQAELAARIKSETEILAGVIKEAGIRPD